ncbi:pyridoxamine 5'-phosphate oxidase family protein [Thalassobacillus sp. CUG 92003]|uniref:pyridoxamine 5'-phosphate oxidase family protein n=1 Tax=Thalassobacillus sp. CUG 92003 TaxID=2736641 RepID=UPI0015E79072|nr:pyridoxamine 5'-phosphate oxidase family protein [Thalassobacillus sp. CUG 92003]
MSGSEGERRLQEKYQTKQQAIAFYDKQMLAHLNELMIDFIRDRDMMFIATSDAQGNCDSSFRAGPQGFVRVYDEQTVFYPEYKGNGVMASLGNIVENPHIGLMLIDFEQDAIGLHINGTADIIEHDCLADVLDLSSDQMQEIEASEKGRALRWVVVSVEEAYIHCSKHIPLMEKQDKRVHWGTDQDKYKGGDYFKAKKTNDKIAER